MKTLHLIILHLHQPNPPCLHQAPLSLRLQRNKILSSSLQNNSSLTKLMKTTPLHHLHLNAHPLMHQMHHLKHPPLMEHPPLPYLQPHPSMTT